MGVRRGAKRAFATLEIGIKSQIFLENPKVGILIPINWFDLAMTFFCLYETHAAQGSGSQL